MSKDDPAAPSYLHTRRERFHRPSLSNRFRHIIVVLRRALASMLADATLTDNTRILDYGCAELPYRNLLPANCRWEGADLAGNAAADIVLLPDGRLPVDGGVYDLVLSTQVLEHVTDPALYLAECYRVLKPGGSLVLSTHGLMVWHPDPIDRWRWTCEGLRHIVETAGFRNEDFRGVMGLGASGMQFVQDAALRRLPRLLHKPLIVVMQLLVAACDRFLDRSYREYDAYVFVVRARKPQPETVEAA